MYRNTDLAEIVQNPSPLTLKYLQHWFTGSNAFGIALSMLGWPINPDNHSLLTWNMKDGLNVDMKTEEIIMYSNTVLRYKIRNGDTQLEVDWEKLYSISKVLNTLKAIWSQSKLLINYQNTYNNAKGYVESIPINCPSSLDEIEKNISQLVWPYVIAVDYIGEYVISVLTYNLSTEARLKMISRIQVRAKEYDWYTQGMLAWSRYNEGLLSKYELVDQFGYLAGDDYELTKPRYYERVKSKKPTITELKIHQMNISNIEDLAVGMHYLRSEAKRRSLIWIAGLRESLIEAKVLKK